MKTFNKRGDEGETSLLYGVRVPKSDPRCEAYGTVDEASSALGLAACFASPRVKTLLKSIQEELIILSGELALPAPDRSGALKKRLVPQMADRLETTIAALEQETEMPQQFVLPGGCPSAAALHLARSITRRAERQVVRLKEQKLLYNPEVLRYLNRLADLLYTLSCYEESCQKPVE